jgi:hypothetical protein
MKDTDSVAGLSIRIIGTRVSNPQNYDGYADQFNSYCEIGIDANVRIVPIANIFFINTNDGYVNKAGVEVPTNKIIRQTYF